MFLDKDGTLIEDVPYNLEPERIELTRGAVEGLQLVHAAGYSLIVITNQSGLAHGYFLESAVVEVEQRLRQLLAAVGVPLAEFYYYPDYPDGILQLARNCSCRKPEPGMLLDATTRHRIDMQQSWFIGDILNDVEADRRAGCRTILIDNGNETEWQLSPQRLPYYIVADLAEAAQVITSVLAPRGEC